MLASTRALRRQRASTSARRVLRHLVDQVEQADQRGDRGLQLMAGVGDEVAPLTGDRRVGAGVLEDQQSTRGAGPARA